MNTFSKVLITVLCTAGSLLAAAQTEAHWSINIYDYQYDMTTYVTLTVDGTPVTDYADYEVAAFCGTECRGVADFRTVEVGGQQVTYGYLRVRSNAASGEDITFKAYRRSMAMEMSVEDVTMPFTASAVNGLPSSPVVLSVATAAEWDEESAEAPQGSGFVSTVTVRRTIAADEWSTLCLPFAMTAEQCQAAFGDDVEIGDFMGCTVDAAQNISVMFSLVDAMEANHPYVIKCSSDVSSFTVHNVDVSIGEARVDKDGDGTAFNSFIGNYASGTVVPDRSLFLSGGKFYFSTGRTPMKAFRGYFSFDAAGADYANYQASRIILTFDRPTAIGSTVARWYGGTEVRGRGGSEARGYGDVGAGALYDFSGRRSSGLRRGVYVSDGKKVMVK